MSLMCPGAHEGPEEGTEGPISSNNEAAVGGIGGGELGDDRSFDFTLDLEGLVRVELRQQFMQEDEMASWLHYSLDDHDDLCAALLYLPDIASTSCTTVSPSRRCNLCSHLLGAFRSSRGGPARPSEEPSSVTAAWVSGAMASKQPF